MLYDILIPESFMFFYVLHDHVTVTVTYVTYV